MRSSLHNIGPVAEGRYQIGRPCDQRLTKRGVLDAWHARIASMRKVQSFWRHL